MVIRNHIAYRLLTDSNLWMEMLESQYPEIYDKFDKEGEVPKEIMSLYHCLSSDRNKSYLVTNSVVENLDLLKINKKDDHYNWEVFKKLPEQKVTFIFQDGTALRMIVSDNTIWFCHIKFNLDKRKENDGQMYWVMFFFDRQTGELCEHFQHQDVKNLEEFVYKFLCFFYLTENTEEVIAPGKVYGTRKTGKISNDFKFPLVMVTAKWNTTTIRTESFGVSGHFRLQPCGPAKSETELIFIDPFIKNGYKRSAGKIAHIN